jgi:hypothetical protein
MGIKKEVILESTGSTAGFHYVSSVNIDRMTKNTNVQVHSYVSEDTYKAGKQPISFGSTVTLGTMPEAGEDPFEFAEKALVAPIPEGVVDTPILPGMMMLSRYALAGGEIV